MILDLIDELYAINGVVEVDHEGGFPMEIGIVDHDQSTYAELHRLLGDRYDTVSIVIVGKPELQ